MDRNRTALFLDFDNVFSGLLKLDPVSALQFARRPSQWLERLSSRYLVDAERRWLVLRCYMNPAGSVENPESDADRPRLHFSRLRPFFTRAGFEVIDCPSLTYQTKNTADIRLVMDAMDALQSETRYDEFVIASGDSDLAPLLTRLRAGDRRTTILSPSDAVASLTSIADRAIDAQQVLGLLQDDTIDDDPEDPSMTVGAETIAQGDVTPGGATLDVSTTDVAEAFESFRGLITEIYEAAEEPENLARLSQRVIDELGVIARESRWYGSGSFGAAIDRLELAHLKRSQHFMWDERRHEPPQARTPRQARAPEPPRAQQPEALERLCTLLDVPRLPQTTWPHTHDALARYAATHDFNLAEASRWSRDTLVDEGVQVGRTALGFIVRASRFGGAPLNATPPPNADDIAAAVVRNVLDRARFADIELDKAEISTIAEWLGGPVPSVDD